MDKFQRATLEDNPDIPENLKFILADDVVFLNSQYQVNLRNHGRISGNVDMVHLSIKRIDKEPIHDWRHMQEIKNQICGNEWVAVEVYPPESKLVDTANQYHLWCFNDPNVFPFIFQTRLVSEDESLGNKQRKFENKPSDLMTYEDMLILVKNKGEDNE